MTGALTLLISATLLLSACSGRRASIPAPNIYPGESHLTMTVHCGLQSGEQVGKALTPRGMVFWPIDEAYSHMGNENRPSLRENTGDGIADA